MTDLLASTTVLHHSQTRRYLFAAGPTRGQRLAAPKWKNTSNHAVYNGISQHLGRHTGQKFEVQFHTPDSFAMKDQVLHPLYEESRLATVTTSRYLDLKTEMAQKASTLEVSAGVASIRQPRLQLQP